MNAEKEHLFEPLAFEEASEHSRLLLEKVRTSMGFIPNLVAKMANNHVLLHGYLAADGAFSRGTFTGAERQLILLAASVENKCQYSVAAHATAAKHLGAQSSVVAAVKRGLRTGDKKLDALVCITQEMVRERGKVRRQTVDDFIGAGYAKEQILEILLGVATKTISSYLDHISPTELDKQFGGVHSQF